MEQKVKRAGYKRKDMGTLGVATRFKKGDNTLQKKPKKMIVLRRLLSDYIKEKPEEWEKAVYSVLAKAKKGDLAAFKAISEYIHPKIPQELDVNVKSHSFTSKDLLALIKTDGESQANEQSP